MVHGYLKKNNYCGKGVVVNERGRNDYYTELYYSDLRTPLTFYQACEFLLKLGK